jgi:hypothetical protein
VGPALHPRVQEGPLPGDLGRARRHQEAPPDLDAQGRRARVPLPGGQGRGEDVREAGLEGREDHVGYRTRDVDLDCRLMLSGCTL